MKKPRRKNKREVPKLSEDKKRILANIEKKSNITLEEIYKNYKVIECVRATG